MNQSYLEVSCIADRACASDDLQKMVVAILKVQAQWSNTVTSDIIIDREELEAGLEAGHHVTEFLAPSIDHDDYRRAVADIVETLRAHSPQPPSPEAFVPEDLDTNDGVEKFIQSVLISDAETEPLHQLVGSLALIPWYMSFAHTVTETVNIGLWKSGLCPVCGHPPIMAVLGREDGVRMMECWLCRAQWVFTRLQCPNCNNTDQNKLRLFTVGGDDAYRVHVCDTCRHYFKVADARAFEADPLLALTDLTTADHDVAAKREGWLPFGRSPFREQSTS